MDTSEDPDTEEALKGFDFLSSPDEMDTSPESRGTGDGTDWGKPQASWELIEKTITDTAAVATASKCTFIFVSIQFLFLEDTENKANNFIL